jgi:D-alanyl-D-alanine carboxypeptidase
MAVIGRVLERQPTLKAIVAQQRFSFQGPPLWFFRNLNTFLTSYAGADGIKTGYETRAGRCLAASATRDGRQVIAVVMNSGNYVADSTVLIDYGFAILAAQPTPLAAPPRPRGLVARALQDASLVPGAVLARAAYRSALRADLVGSSAEPWKGPPSGSVLERLTAGNAALAAGS